ncbi:MAG: CYTH domain-containing protein [Clostridia bacterium]|nr:CYTH domain-containing protein [Clostridia bacterium]
MEIERKFLVGALPNLEGCRYSEIKQGYVSFSPEIRVRQLNDKYYRTEKGEGMIMREENEWEIDKETADQMFSQVKTNIIKKTRYYIPYNKYTIELDIYKGIFKGLVVAEVEFSSLDEAKAFSPPDWFLEDISEKREYRNKILALKRP